MIEGVTKPFTLDRPQLSDAEMRAGAAAYSAGIRKLIGRYGTGEINIDMDFSEEDSPVTNVQVLVFPDWAENDNPGGLIAAAPDTVSHNYGIDLEGILRRTDSKHDDASGSRVPPLERFGGSSRDRFRQSLVQALREQALGINSAPVDEEEVNNLFAVIHREYPV